MRHFLPGMQAVVLHSEQCQVGPGQEPCAEPCDQGIIGVEVEVVVVAQVGASETDQAVDRVADLRVERTTGEAVRSQLQRGDDLAERKLRGVLVAGAALFEFAPAPKVRQSERMGAEVGTQVEVRRVLLTFGDVVRRGELEGPGVVPADFRLAARCRVGEGSGAEWRRDAGRGNDQSYQPWPCLVPAMRARKRAYENKLRPGIFGATSRLLSTAANMHPQRSLPFDSLRTGHCASGRVPDGCARRQPAKNFRIASPIGDKFHRADN